MKQIVFDAGKNSGVVEFCLLVLLFCFDVVVDILPDYMHMLKNILPGHLLLVLNGNRVPNAPKYKNATKEDDDKKTRAVARETNALWKSRWLEAMRVLWPTSPHLTCSV